MLGQIEQVVKLPKRGSMNIELGFLLYIAIALSVILGIHERISERQTTPLWVPRAVLASRNSAFRTNSMRAQGSKITWAMESCLITMRICYHAATRTGESRPI